MADHIKIALQTKEARLMMIDARRHTSTLPETLMLGADHILSWLELQATREERAKSKEPVKPAKGVPRG